MYTVLIPPIPHLNLAEGRKGHLLLSHLCDDLEYRRFYVEEGHKGAFLTLDNGAHENQSGEGPRRLLDLAVDYHVNEIVCPDYLFDATQTVNLTGAAFTYFMREGLDRLKALHPRLMVVPQGDDIRSWRVCLYSLIDLYYRSGICDHAELTIGLSKDYEVWPGGLYRLIRGYLIALYEEIPNLQLHLLGWGRNLWELPHIAHEFGDQIRSIDSAKPFVYGMRGVRVRQGEVPIYPTRPPNYFQTTIQGLDTVQANIRDFDSLSTETFLRS